MIVVDDLRPEFGAYGKNYVHSPNLDRIAARGLTFNHAYCQQAVCSPSRSSLLTGTRPYTTKVWDLVTHFRTALPDVVTLPQHFKQNGYFVQGMGKIYHGGYNDAPSWSVPWTRPNRQVYASPENKAIVKRIQEEATKAGKKLPLTGPGSRGPAYESADVPDESYHDGALADSAITALRSMKPKEQPFFLAVGFIKPHLPFVAPKKYWDLYDPAKIELATNQYRPKEAPEYAVLEGAELRAYHEIPRGHIPDALARQLKHGYYAAISYMDAQVGKVLDEVERLGLRDDTIVVVWGDHGWKLGEHDAWCKQTCVENDTNASLIVSVPGMKSAGKRTDAIVEFVDIYPTLAGLARLSKPSHLEGADFAPVLASPEKPWKSAAFSQFPRNVAGKQLMGYTMRTDRYRLTQWVERDNKDHVVATELYDHQTDPQENQNIAGETANCKLVAELSDKWKRGWREAVPK